jgi:hypothetical protein
VTAARLGPERERIFHARAAMRAEVPGSSSELPCASRRRGRTAATGGEQPAHVIPADVAASVSEPQDTRHQPSSRPAVQAASLTLTVPARSLLVRCRSCIPKSANPKEPRLPEQH